MCPVVQPLRVAGAKPSGSIIIQWRGRSWCVWPRVRRSTRWFNTVLRATAERLGWPAAARRRAHGLRGGRNIEAKSAGVSRAVRHAICWWSLRGLLGSQLAYEPPTLPEMALATRTTWGTIPFALAAGDVPYPLVAVAGAREPPAPRPPSRGRFSPRGGRTGSMGRGGTAAAAASVSDSDSSSDDDGDSYYVRLGLAAAAAAVTEAFEDAVGW